MYKGTSEVVENTLVTPPPKDTGVGVKEVETLNSGIKADHG